MNSLESDKIMLALQFATTTANLASQNAFLFLATHG
jgi:hypothetical protein